MVIMEMNILFIIIVLITIITTIQHSSSVIQANHNINVVFIQTIPSCTIWYCMTYWKDTNTTYYEFNYGMIFYNHYLNYNDDSTLNNGYMYGKSNKNGTDYNYHNTTLLFGNMNNAVLYKLSHHVLYGIV